MHGTITIVLADDHQVVRQGLRALLESEPGFSVVGEASDGLRVAGVVERLDPDVVVVDLMMPGLGGLEVTRQVRRGSPRTRVVILSMHASEAYVVEALRNGASAYVIKDASAAELIRAIHETAAGRRYLSAPLSSHSIDSYLRKAREAARDPYETLTAREREVLHLATEGRTSIEIARRLGISPRTAETHRANILHKLDLHGQTELIRYALSRGIVPPRVEPVPPRGRRGLPAKNP